MPRARRHRRIAELITGGPVGSQGELRRLLEAEGLGVTQATLSRDLRSLGVSKGPGGYRLPGQAPAAEGTSTAALHRTLTREVLATDWGSSVVVLRTAPGHANALAVEIDRQRPSDILGTIAGDDTVFIATRSPRQAKGLLRQFRAWLEPGAVPA